jgi:hypothetical protein
MPTAYLEVVLDEVSGRVTVNVRRSDGTTEIAHSDNDGHRRVKEIMDEFMGNIPDDRKPK